MSTPDLSILSTKSVEKRVAANAGLMLGSKALGALFGLLCLAIASKTISIATLGIVLFLHTYHLFFAQLATFQAWQTIIRFGMDDIKNDDALSSRLLRQFRCFRFSFCFKISFRSYSINCPAMSICGHSIRWRYSIARFF